MFMAMHEGGFWKRVLAATLTLACVFPAQAQIAGPDRIYVNGKIWTGASQDEFEQGVAVTGDRIAAVGNDRDIRALATSRTKIIDLGGKLVTPGLIDNHTHFFSASLAMAGVDLREAASPAEFARRIADRARARPGEWVLHGNWDHELWNGQLPDRSWVDETTGSTPVFVRRLDGHMALANSAALAAAGIGAKTPDPEGGLIVRDGAGRPTGLLKDAAMSLVERVIPPPSEAQMDEALARGVAEALANGVTQIHDMGDWSSLDAFRRARSRNRLGLRVYSFVPVADWARLAAFVQANGRGDDWLRWGGLKGFVDGSLGSTTAWFHAPYADAPDTAGLTQSDPALLYRQIADADRAGLHVTVHAIGDRANDWLLDSFQTIAEQNGRRDRRFRIEHAQHLSPAAIARFAELGVIPSMQPYHAIDDGRWAEKRIGAERLKGTYAFRSLLDADTRLTFGSDWAVAPLKPIMGIYGAATRRTIDGANPAGWQPQEKISVAQAVAAYTTGNAYAGYQEARLGRIAPGFLADFVILSEDIFTIDPARIADVKVERTIVGGREAYVREQ